MDKRLEKFLRDLVRQAHGEILPAALEEKMMMDLNLQFQQQLHDISLAALPTDADRLQYQNLVMGEFSADRLSAFLHDRIPDIDTQLSNCATAFQKDYLALCQNQG